MENTLSEPETKAPSASPPVARRQRRYYQGVGLWLLELVTAFVAVYAAFLLNNYQASRASALRREQILTYLEKELTMVAASLHSNEKGYNEGTGELLRKIAAGEMPPLEPLDWASSAIINDQGWLIQAGGLELLSIDTIAALKTMSATYNADWDRMSHFQRLSDALLAPHVGDPADYFYDPVSHQLRPRFAAYPAMLRFGSATLHDVGACADKALAEVRKERQRPRP